MDGKKRGSYWGAVLGGAVLLLGALCGQRLGTAGQLVAIAGAVLLGYHVWALLRRSGKRSVPSFPMPDPEAEEKALKNAKARMAALERQYRAGEIGYETYMRKRVEIVNER